MINLGLARISKLLASSSISWKAVHIAGTNGKGSVANFISSLLHSSGLSVGRFNSPHLIDRWDCISINQETVSESVFLSVERSIKARDELEKIHASEFELLTATAFEIFNQAKIDVGVIECGLGGRLDATNVLRAEQVLCSVFTKIGMDHEAFLGDNVIKIAGEKAGIMKQGVPFVADTSNAMNVLMTLDEYAVEVGAMKNTLSLPAVVNKQLSIPLKGAVEKCVTDLAVEKDTDGHHGEESDATLDTSQWPLHQQENLRTALLAWHTIQTDTSVACKLGRVFKHHRSDDSLSLDQILAIDPSRLEWPGRLQLVDTSKITGDKKAALLDGAHNEQAAHALSRHIDATYRPHDSLVWIIAMSKGKKIEAFASALLRHGDQVVVTQFGPVDGMPWVQCEDMTELAQIIRTVTHTDVHMEAEPQSALHRASQIASGNSQVVVCGSLYLVGNVLRLLR